MSRQIDWTQPLGDADRAWAEQFSAHHPLIALNDQQFGGADADEEDDDEVQPYEKWSKDELAAEVTKRGLSAPAKAKASDLIAVLEADDEANAGK